MPNRRENHPPQNSLELMIKEWDTHNHNDNTNYKPPYMLISLVRLYFLRVLITRSARGADQDFLYNAVLAKESTPAGLKKTLSKTKQSTSK